jgi:hypothetical protein
MKRFILTSIDSIPHLEAVLLLRANPNVDWDVKMVAQRLFICEKKALEIMDDLVKAGFVSLKKNALYSFEPASDKLREMINDLSGVYYGNLIEITNLIHSKIGKQAQEFGNAFRWNDEG